jgi:predicted ABC-type exoprotein transport system permease subunit
MELTEIVYHKKRNTFFSYILTILCTLGVSLLILPLILRPMLNKYATPKINISQVGSLEIILEDDEDLTSKIINTSASISVTASFDHMINIGQEQKVKFFNVINVANGQVPPGDVLD